MGSFKRIEGRADRQAGKQASRQAGEGSVFQIEERVCPIYRAQVLLYDWLLVFCCFAKSLVN